VLEALRDKALRDERGAAPLSLVYERVRGLQGSVQCYSCVRGTTDFDLFPSVAPPPSAPVVPSSPAPSFTSKPPPSTPPLQPLLAQADAARALSSWEEALAAYKCALMVAPSNDLATRATIYLHIGDVKRAQGKLREAELNYEKALSTAPEQKGALEALIAVATSLEEPKRVAEWRRKLLATLTDPTERLEQLRALAALYETALKDKHGVINVLEEARVLTPKDGDLLARLRAGYEGLHRWPEVAEVLGAECEAEDDPKLRAVLRFTQADIVLGRQRDEQRGLELLDATLEDDPAHDKALHALVSVRTSRSEWPELEASYTRLVDRLARLSDAERASEVCRKLGALRRDKLRDAGGAIEAFTGALLCKPTDVDARAMLADMYLAAGDEIAATREFEHVALHAPTRTSTFTRLFTLHMRAGRTDQAWLVATALEALGSADVDQQLLVDQYRLEGPIRPTTTLDDAAWDSWLRAPGADEVVAGVFRAALMPAVRLKVDELRSAKKLLALDPEKRQSASSTVSMVRSFQWASHVLGITAPDLYVMGNVPGGIAAVQGPEPSTALGPDVLRGMSTRDLAFLAGRHLAYYRPEHQVLIHYSTLDELSVLFLSIVKLAMPEVPVPTQLGAAVDKLRKELGRNARDEERDAMKVAVKKLDERGGRVDLAAWIKSVELSAGRVGLLLCGDMAVAAARLRAEARAIAELTMEDRRGDLLAFCASNELAALRAHLSVAAKPSLRPPALQAEAVG
jgi:tetratricopeptide (TPR) repeat protein